jgi:hypothetical protein
LDNKSSWKYEYRKKNVAGAGTQTAGLAFGGYTATVIQEQQKNMMEHLDNFSCKYATARSVLGGAGTQSSALAFGGDIHLLQEQQKNGQVQHQQQLQSQLLNIYFIILIV